MKATIELLPEDFNQIVEQAAQRAQEKVIASLFPSARPAFPKIVEFWPEQGGYLGAVMRGKDGNQDYCIIVADKEHEFSAEFGSRGKEEIATDNFDGFKNTKAMVESSHSYPAAEKCAALKINGFSDWFLFSRREARALFSNSSELFDSNPWYWTSTQYSSGSAYYQAFADGSQGGYDEDNELRVRPVRRLFI